MAAAVSIAAFPASGSNDVERAADVLKHAESMWPTVKTSLEAMIAAAKLGDAPAEIAAREHQSSGSRLRELCTDGNMELVVARIAHSVLVSEQDVMNDETALHIAARSNHELIQLLLAAGARTTIVDVGGWTPLHCAAYVGKLECVNALLAVDGFGADVVNQTNKWGQTPLHIASESGHVAVFNTLLAAGAHLTKTSWGEIAYDNAGETPLHKAAKKGHLGIVQAALAAGADKDVRTWKTNFTPLHLAGEAGHVDVVRALLAAGADAKAQAKGGETPRDTATDAVKAAIGW